MNPDNRNELPAMPVPEQPYQAGQFESQPVPQVPVPVPPTDVPVAPPTPQVQPQSAAPVPMPSQAMTNPLIADDTDLIEKEWVQRAKQIIAETKDDPFWQSAQLGHVKADYIKKRYNKDIKTQGGGAS